MSRKLMKTMLVLVAMAGVAALPGCDTGDANEPDTALTVAVTIYPVEYFTREVGGIRTTIVPLVRAGTDAHDFELTPGTVRELQSADVLVYSSPAFESWVAGAINAVEGSLTVVEAGHMEGEEAGAASGDDGDDHGHDHEGEDPHVWLNPAEAIEMVERIEAGLKEADPNGAPTYSINAEALIGRLRALDQDFSEGLQSCEHDTFVASHLAYGHLAERYGLEQLGLTGLSDEAEPGPQHISEIVESIRALGLGHVLVEPLSNQALAETVARETGAQLLPLHPLESLLPSEVEADDDYFTVMERNLANLRTALDCSG